jgi:hypothetical protein
MDEPDNQDRSDGTIALCPHEGCAFTCCQFQQGNYIVLYPGELEAAIASGSSVGHLRITSPYNGGFKAICEARETATCDQGYKPLDCKSYPYFPVVKNGQVQAGLKGKKCPLTPNQIQGHSQFVERQWLSIVREKPEVMDWLAAVQLVGYEDM